MAEQQQPKYFDIEDYETGKKYRVEAFDDQATYDEAVEYLSTLPEEDLTQYEYAPQGSPVTSAAAPIRSPAVKTEEPAQPRRNVFIENSTGGTTRYTEALRERPDLVNTAEAMWEAGERDPNKYNELLGTNVFNEGAIAQVRSIDAYYKAQGYNPAGRRFTYIEETGIPEPEAPETVTGSLLQSAKKTILQTGNTAYALAGLGADLVGADETAEDLLETYIERTAATEYYNPDAVGSLENVEFSNASQYAAEAIGSLLPDLATGGVAAFAGKQAGEVVAKRAVANFIEDQVNAGVPHQIAENIATQAVAKRIVNRSVTAAVTGQSIAQETGAIYGDTFTRTGERAPLSSIAAGVLSGSLDAIIPVRFLENMGIKGDVVRQAFGKSLGKALTEGAKGAAIEGGTEALQTFIAELPTSYITGESPFTEDMLMRMADSFTKGVIGGSTVQAASAAVTGDYRGPEATPIIMDRESTIVQPEGKRNSKKYKQGLADATTSGQEIVDDVVSGWSNKPNVTVLPNFQNETVDNDALGVYRGDGNIILNTEAIIKEANARGVSPDAVMESVLFHEALGHYGLETLYRDNLDAKLIQFYEQGSKDFVRMVDSWVEQNPGAYTDPATGEVDIARAAEEVLAEMSEEGNIPRSMIDELLNMIKDFMRNMGLDSTKLFRDSLKFSERELRTVVAIGQSKVRDGEQADVTGISGGYKYLTAWHGSPKDFDKFDHRYMGTGEGQQVFGWGTYLTADRNIAETNYRDRLSPKKISFAGIEGPLYNLRTAAKEKAALQGIDDALFEDAWRHVVNNEGKTSAKDIYAYENNLEKGSAYSKDPDEEWSKLSPEDKRPYEEVSEFFKKNYVQKSLGKVYEVDLPDDSTWLEYENSISDQPELIKALEDQGISALDDEQFRQLNRQYAGISSEYQREVRAYQDPNLSDEQADIAFNRANELAPELNRLKRLLDGAVSAESDGRSAYAALSQKLGGDRQASLYLSSKGFTGNRYLADNLRKNRERKGDGTDVFNYVVFDDQTPKIVAKYSKPKDYTKAQDQNDIRRFGPASRYTNEDEAFEAWDTAYTAYRDLEERVFDKDEASDAEFEMVRAASDNAKRAELDYLRTKPKDKFNYFHEDRYKDALYGIKNRTEQEQLEVNQVAYFEATNDNTARSMEFDPSNEADVDTFSQMLAAPRDPRKVLPRETTYKFGLNPPESNDKYARPMRRNKKVDPLTIDELTADDLFNSLNALEILTGVTENYVAPTMSLDDLQNEALLRDVPVSAVQKLSVKPGDFVVKMFQYDVVARKLNDRVATLAAKINGGRYTQKDKSDFLKASFAFEDVTAKIFGLQSEYGRALRAIQEMEYTSKNIRTIRDALQGLTGEVESLQGLDDPETFEKFARSMAKRIQIKANPAESSLGDKFASAINTPRAIMSSFDLSAPMRQGVFFIGRKEYYKAWSSMFSGVRAEQNYTDMMKDVMRSQYYPLMSVGKLFISSLDGDLSGREESFQSNFAQNVPGVRRSEVAYAAFLNKLRTDLFTNYIKTFEDAGYELVSKVDPKTGERVPKGADELTEQETAILKGLGSFINAGTGRGNLTIGDRNGKMSRLVQSAGPLLNALLFSPGLIASRIRLLNPVWYATLPAPVRKEAIKEAAKFYPGLAMTLGLIQLAAAAMGEEEDAVEWDPRSSNFLKVNINGNRYDISGGMAQYMTLFTKGLVHSSNLLFDTKIAAKKTSTGGLRRYEDDFRDRTFFDDIVKFGRYKLSPMASLFADFADGKNAVGEPFTVAKAVGDRMMPLYMQDLLEISEEEGGLSAGALAGALPGFFGVGVSRYTAQPLDTKQELVAPDGWQDEELPDGENNFVLVRDGKVILKDNAARMYEKTVNAFFQEIIQEQVAMPEWPNLSPKEQAEIIEDAKRIARNETKRYISPLIGIEDAPVEEEEIVE